MPPIIDGRGLTKRFGDVQALDGLDLTAEPGQVVAVLGPNGAGKTTFVRMVATLTRPDAGTLHIAGIDAVAHPDQVRRIIGLAGQHAAVEEALTGRENLEMIAHLFGHRRRQARLNAEAVLDQLRLREAADRRVRTYSGGMRRRLDLGASLVGAPRLLLLDEPTTGLDPRSRIELWEAIRGLVQGGTDVLLTTQYLDEADQLASRIVIVDHGRVVVEGTPDQLKAQAGRDVIELHLPDRQDLARVADALAPLSPEAPRIDPVTRSLAIAVDGGTSRLPEAVRVLDQLGLRPDDIAQRRPTLDEVFLTLTGDGTDPTPDDAARPARQPTGHEPAGVRRMTAISSPRPSDAGASRALERVTAAAHPARLAATANAVAGRTVRKFARTPQLLVVSTIQGAMFLLIFRYVFGGAIQAGPVPYVDFLVPGFVVTSVLFSGMGGAAGVAEDVDDGFFDRLRSLPVRRSGLVLGRSLADTALLTWSLVVTIAIGFAIGFRIQGSVAAALGAFGLCVVYGFAFTWLFITIGLLAGNAQAAQGMALLVFPLTFVSSAYVPIDTMPGWMQAFARNQPITPMVDAVRCLVLGGPHNAGLTGATGHYVVVSLLWSVALVVVFVPITVARYRSS